MQPSANVDHSLIRSHDRTRSSQDWVSPYHAIEGVERALRGPRAASPAPRDFASALYRRLQKVERRETWDAFRRVLARFASVLVIEGD